MGPYLVVDSGTSNTRVRLWHDGRIVATALRAVGSRDTAAAGHNGALAAALREAIGEARWGAEPVAVICSGMITSNLGLYEVPHQRAPATLDDLARGMAGARFPELCELPFHFVPGVKTLPEGPIDAANLHTVDLMRGEETEIAGLLDQSRIVMPSLFLHLGSHHKAILVDEGPAIAASSTALTGELLDAVRCHTVLSGSTLSALDFEPSPEVWRLGLDLARREGLGRALFLVRAAEQLWARSHTEATALLLGALIGLDLQMLEGYRGRAVTTVIYGKGAFGPLLHDCLGGAEYGEVRLVDEATSDEAAARGAVALFERAVELGVVEAATARA
jgi:2-dehydro-3-deoxygalactonokinase